MSISYILFREQLNILQFSYYLYAETFKLFHNVCVWWLVLMPTNAVCYYQREVIQKLEGW